MEDMFEKTSSFSCKTTGQKHGDLMRFDSSMCFVVLPHFIKVHVRVESSVNDGDR